MQISFETKVLTEQFTSPLNQQTDGLISSAYLHTFVLSSNSLTHFPIASLLAKDSVVNLIDIFFNNFGQLTDRQTNG